MDDLDFDYSLLFDTPPARSRPASKMKPNTRFLQHIVREANSHNAALLAKETADSQKRLRKLIRRDGGQSDEEESGRRHESRRRRDRDAECRRRKGADAGDDRHHSTRHRSSRSHHERERDRTRRRRERDERSEEQEKEEGSRRSRSDRNYDKSRPRARSVSDDDNAAERSAKHNRSHRASRAERRSQSPEDRDRDRAQRRHRERSPLSDGGRPGGRRRNGGVVDDESDTSTDSDPLEDFVGPRTASDANKTAVRIRGRGVPSSGASRMDAHFAADYDPAADAHADPDGDKPAGSPTVEDARVEMQRDRQEWLRAGAARLKAAGFTDREIAIWARGGKRGIDKSDTADAADKETDMRWTKAGEAREWDRGKVAGEDGPAKPLWAR